MRRCSTTNDANAVIEDWKIDAVDVDVPEEAADESTTDEANEDMIFTAIYAM